MAEDKENQIEKKLDGYLIDWAHFKGDMKTAMIKIDMMHGTLNRISDHTAHLSKLDSLEKIETKLTDQAAGHTKRRDWTYIVAVGLLCLTIVVIVLGQNSKQLELRPNSISITDSHAQEAKKN